MKGKFKKRERKEKEAFDLKYITKNYRMEKITQIICLNNNKMASLSSLAHLTVMSV